MALYPGNWHAVLATLVLCVALATILAIQPLSSSLPGMYRSITQYVPPVFCFEQLTILHRAPFIAHVVRSSIVAPTESICPPDGSSAQALPVWYRWLQLAMCVEKTTCCHCYAS